MPAPRALKQISTSLGVYGPARRIFRRFSPEVRKQRRGDLELYRQFIRPRDLVFDIGANMGQKADIFLALGAKTVSVEPNPNCWPIIKAEFGSNPNFSLVRKAISSETGEATLTFAHTASTASLNPKWGALNYSDAPLESCVVETTTLDDLIQEHGVPSFCKIDVEGLELEVVKGLSVPIPILSLEFHKKDPQKIRKCFDVLSEISPLKVNSIAMNEATLSHSSWISADEFMASMESADAPAAGDVFVRMKL